MGEELVRRAKAAGRMREDVASTDLPIIQVMLSVVIDASSEVQPGLYRRFLDIVLRGISADPDAEPSPTEPPLAPEEIDHVMTYLKTPRR